jgi:hypothetical protein
MESRGCSRVGAGCCLSLAQLSVAALLQTEHAIAIAKILCGCGGALAGSGACGLRAAGCRGSIHICKMYNIHIFFKII